MFHLIFQWCSQGPFFDYNCLIDNIIGEGKIPEQDTQGFFNSGILHFYIHFRDIMQKLDLVEKIVAGLFIDLFKNAFNRGILQRE